MDYDNLIFLHIPKAAGSTLHPVLERHYSRRTRQSVSEPEQVEAFKRRPEEERRRIRLLKGHMPFGMHRYLEGRSRYITLLRHPVERVISHYYYVKRTPDHYLYPHLQRGMGLADFARAGISGEMDNGQVRLLSGHDQDIPFGECTPDMLDTAKRNIEEHFAVTGLTEQFDESLTLMSIVLGWRWTPYYLSRNVTQDKPVARQVDPEVLRAIEETNSLDLDLYAWSVNRFRNQIAQHQSRVDERLVRLGRANRLYRPIGGLLYDLRRSLKRHVATQAG